MTTSFEWGAELPRLSGRRIDLRRLTPADAPALFEVFGDPEVTRFWSTPPLVDLAAARELLAEVRRAYGERRLFCWGIVRREDGGLIGTCTLAGLDRTHRRSEIGFALGRAAWGRGLATEAVEVLLHFAFETLDLHRVEADVDPGNAPSLRLLERQGFRREGHLRERWHVHGQVHDGVFLGLLQREWAGPAARSRPS